MVNKKEVKIEVIGETKDQEIQELDQHIRELKKQRIQIGIDIAQEKLKDTQNQIEKLKQEKITIQANAERLNEVQSRIDAINSVIKSSHNYNVNVSDEQLNDLKQELSNLENEKINLEVNADDSRIKEIDGEIAQLDQKSLDLELSIETAELEKAKAEVDELDGREVELNLAIQNFSQGISQAKQGISELKQNMDEVAQAGMQSEQNKAFLTMNMGAEKARDTYQQISDIVARMPGDDNTMRSVLSTAQALGNNLKPDEMEAASKTMADYMSGSATMGKMALESQQDIMKYLLDGNTAELERGSIVSAHVDKLKDITTFQERQAAMQEVLNELGYGGISQQDTMLNKQAEWEGMLYNSRDALSSMWLGAEKGAMDYIIKLNDASNGLVGMGIVAGQMVAGPFVDIMGGLSQIGMGFKTLKQAADFTGITNKLSGLKAALTGVSGGAKSTITNMVNLARTLMSTVLSAVKNAITGFINLGREVLLAGFNALKSAGLWIIQKAQMVASTLATWMATAAQGALNLVMSMNPIMLVVMAIVALIAVLGYLYFNNEQVRASIDGLGQTLMGFGQWVYNGAIYWINQLITTLQNLWNYITTLGGLLPSNVSITGNKIIDTILRVILFIATLPMQLGMIFVNIIARALGFSNNFSQKMINGASNAVNGFISWIATLPGKLWEELNKMLKMAQDFAMRIADTLTFGGASMVTGWQYGSGEHSPGYMYESFKGELDAMDSMAVTGSDRITSKMSKAGSGIVESFNQMLDFDFNWDWLKDFDFKGITANIPNNKDTDFNIKDITSNTDLVKVITNNEKSKSGDTIINIYGDVDSDRRVQQIKDVIINEINWDNTTGGRTV